METPLILGQARAGRWIQAAYCVGETAPKIDGGLIALTCFSGEIGFFLDKYLEIICLYMEGIQ